MDDLHGTDSAQRADDGKPVRRRASKRWWFLLPGASVLVLLTLLICNLLQPKTAYQMDVEALQKQIARGAGEAEIQQALDKAAGAGTFRVSINPVITVDDGKKGDVRIENSRENTYGVRTDIVVTDSVGTEVTVYSSKTIAPGYSLEYGEFKYLPPDRPVDAIAVMHAINLNTGREEGTVKVRIVLQRKGS